MKVTAEPKTPTPGSLAAIDEAVRHIQTDQEPLAEWKEAYCRNHRERLARDLDLIQRCLPPKKSIVDFGSAPHVLPLALDRLGYKVTAVDIAPERFQIQCPHRVEFIKADFETDRLEALNSSHDCVIMNEVFEHLRININQTVRTALSCLGKDGLFIISTPNLRSIAGLYRFLFKGVSYSCSPGVFDEYEKLSLLGHMGHVREYTTRELIEYFRHHQLSVTEIVYRGQSRLPKPWMRFLATHRPSMRPFQVLIMKKQA